MSHLISIYLLVVIFLPLMILVEVETERKLPILPLPPPPNEVEEKEVKPPPPRLPIVVMWPMCPMVLIDPKEPKPEIKRTGDVFKPVTVVWYFYAFVCSGLRMWHFNLISDTFLTWVKRREASTKGRKTNKSPKKWTTCLVATRPILVPPAAAEKRIITKRISTWEERKDQQR